MAAATGTETFAIRPIVAGGPAGSVIVAPASQVVRYHVTVTGLVPGSAHTIHDHLGSCSAAANSQHLMTLATATADRSGVITFDATVPPFEAGPGRIVIVYSTASNVLITGCAQL